MVALWILAAGLVLGYYLLPGFAGVLESVREWQVESGWVAAFLNRVVFCGLLPGIFLLTVKSIRPRRPVRTVLAYCVWAGCWGIACDCFFTFQTRMFGDGRDMMTLVKKTLVDQFVWNVFICTPANALFFPWVENDFRGDGGLSRGVSEFVFGHCAAMLVSNWTVWLPVTMAVYAFPLPLQIQLVGFAGAFWMLVALRAAARSREGR